MTYEQFLDAVKQHELTLAELRCDVSPSEVVLDLIDDCQNYEKFVMRYSTVNETKKIAK